MVYLEKAYAKHYGSTNYYGRYQLELDQFQRSLAAGDDRWLSAPLNLPVGETINYDVIANRSVLYRDPDTGAL